MCCRQHGRSAAGPYRCEQARRHPRCRRPGCMPRARASRCSARSPGATASASERLMRSRSVQRPAGWCSSSARYDFNISTGEAFTSNLFIWTFGDGEGLHGDAGRGGLLRPNAELVKVTLTMYRSDGTTITSQRNAEANKRGGWLLRDAAQWRDCGIKVEGEPIVACSRTLMPTRASDTARSERRLSARFRAFHRRAVRRRRRRRPSTSSTRASARRMYPDVLVRQRQHCRRQVIVPPGRPQHGAGRRAPGLPGRPGVLLQGYTSTRPVTLTLQTQNVARLEPAFIARVHAVARSSRSC